MARLDRESLAIFLWNLVAVKFRDFLALILWRCATLLLWSFSANGFWNRKAFIFVDSIALFHQGLTAFLPWHVPALLSINLSTTWRPVRIVGISTDLLGDWLAFLFVNSVAVTVWNILAIPLWNLVAFFLLNDMTFLGRNMITYLFIYELAVLLSDDLTSCFRAKNALFLMALTANFLETRVTLLIVFSLAILLMDCFVNSPRNADTQELWDVVALFILDFVASFSGILGSLTFLLKLCPTLFSICSSLSRLHNGFTDFLFHICTNPIRNVLALCLDLGFINCLLHLLTHLLRLATFRRKGGRWSWGKLPISWRRRLAIT